jgi:hypothetical protein
MDLKALKGSVEYTDKNGVRAVAKKGQTFTANETEGNELLGLKVVSKANPDDKKAVAPALGAGLLTEAKADEQVAVSEVPKPEPKKSASKSDAK